MDKEQATRRYLPSHRPWTVGIATRSLHDSEHCRPRQVLRWVASLRWVGADVDSDAHQRDDADQQEHADDDHGRSVTPLSS